MCVSMPPAVSRQPSPATTSVPGPMTTSTPGCTSGLPAFPMPEMRPSLIPTSALTMPEASTITAFVITVSATVRSALERWLWPMPSRMTLPPPNFTSSP